MKLSVVPLLLIAALLSACVQNVNAEDILAKVYDKYSKIKSYRARIHEISDGKERHTLVAFKRPDKLRIEYPSENKLSVFNGSVLWIKSGDNFTEKLYVEEIPDVYYGYILEVLKTHDVELSGEEEIEVGGYKLKCYVLTAKSRDEERNVEIKKIWVVKYKWYPAKILLKVRFELPDERLEISNTTLEFEKIEFNVPLNNSTFRVT